MMTTTNYDALTDVSRQIKIDSFWLHFCAIATGITIGFFIIKFFVGGDLSPSSWTPEQWASVVIAVLITIVISAAKDRLYQSNRTGAAILLGTVIMIGFGYFGETSQTMEREDATVKHRSEASPVFMAGLAKIHEIEKSTGGEQSAALLADANAKLAEARTALSQCSTRYHDDKLRGRCRMARQKDIAGWQAKADTYKQAGKAAVADHQAANGRFIAQLHGFEHDESKHYAMIREIRDALGVSSDTASLLFALMIVTAFEYGHWFFGRNVKMLKAEACAHKTMEYERPATAPHEADDDKYILNPALKHTAPVIDMAAFKASRTPVVPIPTHAEPPAIQLGIPSLDVALKIVADDLYPDWISAVKAKDITNAKDPGQKFIWRETAKNGDGKQVLSAPETARIWEIWQDRAVKNGVFVANPKYQVGNRQPKYILSAGVA
jgi:hypothetical protein